MNPLQFRSVFLLILGVTLATDFLLILRHKHSSLCSFIIVRLLPFRILRPCYGVDVPIHSKATPKSKLHFLGPQRTTAITFQFYLI